LQGEPHVVNLIDGLISQLQTPVKKTDSNLRSQVSSQFIKGRSEQALDDHADRQCEGEGLDSAGDSWNVLDKFVSGHREDSLVKGTFPARRKYKSTPKQNQPKMF